MNSPKLSTFLHPSFRTVRRAALSSNVSHSHQGDKNRGGEDTKNTNTPPIEDPQHIKKDISVGGNDNAKETYTNEDDNNNEQGSKTVNEEGDSTLLKDQSGAQDQSSSSFIYSYALFYITGFLIKCVFCWPMCLNNKPSSIPAFPKFSILQSP